MKSRNLDSPKEKQNVMSKHILFLFSCQMKLCTGQHRKGNALYIYKGKGWTYKGIDGGYIDRTVLKSQLKGHIVGSTVWGTSQNIAPFKGIWIWESGKFLLVNSGIPGFGIRNTA